MVDDTLLTVSLILTSLLCVGLAIIIWRMSNLRTKFPFICLLIATAWLSATYLLELLSFSLNEMLFWNDLEYISNVCFPPLFLVFTLVFIGRIDYVNTKNMAILFSIPAVALAMLWTNDLHHLFYTVVAQPSSPYLQTFEPTYGPWFYVFAGFSLIVIVSSYYLLLKTYFRVARYLRLQVAIVMISCVLPIIAFAVGYLAILDLPFTFIMILSFVASMSLLFIGAYRYELFNIMPLALDTVVERMKDGVVVMDNHDHIIHINPSAEAMLNMVHERGVFRHMGDSLPFLKEPDLEEALNTGRSLEVSIPKEGKEHFYDVQATSMNDQSGARAGVQLIIRDIDDERRMKEQLLKANTRLSILSMVLRHDTMNQVGVIHGYSELISSGRIKTDDIARYGDRIKEAVKYIEHQFNFANEYQSLGRSDPQWQWMQLVLAKAKTSGASEGLEVVSELGSLSVLADPLLEKIFTILLNNSRKHGKRATQVKITYRIEGGSCIIVYEDNGVGIPEHLKQAVFNKDYAPNGGMGLYVASQIMLMTGGTIREVGTEGQGARFEMVFPEGNWKEDKLDLSSMAKVGEQERSERSS